MSHSPNPELAAELVDLRVRLADAEDALNAIRNGEVDGLVMAGPEGRRVFTLEGAQEPYRLLTEQMSEGALTMSQEGFILYANQPMARLLRTPLERVIGAEFRTLVAPEDQPVLAGLVGQARDRNSRGVLSLQAAGGPPVPVRLGLSRLQMEPETLVCIVVTDLTESRLYAELEQRVAARTSDLAAARLAALNLMEEAVQSRGQIEQTVADLRWEMAVRKRAEVALRDLSHRLMAVQETNRRELARELHDRVGQNLTALSLNLSILQSVLPPASAQQIGNRLDDSVQLVAETMERMRDVMAELRPPMLDDYGLPAALRWYVGRFAQRTGLHVRVDGEELAPRLPVEVETALFRIAEESLTNVARHAQARNVVVTLAAAKDKVRFTIADDGAGFDPPAAGRCANWGLTSMRERAEAVGAHWRVESAPGRGTTVIVEVPKAGYEKILPT